MAGLIVHRPGSACTVQDMGRPGYLEHGLSRGGAMDVQALAEGAALLGQAPELAALEMAGTGAEYEARGDLRIALTGAEMEATIDGAAVAWNASHPLREGQRLRIGAARVMLADEYPDFGALSPDALGGSPVLLHLECDDVDALTAQATRAGAMLLRAPATQSFGERNAMVQDPFGHRWMLTRTVEVVAPEDMQRRWDEGAG